MLQNVLQPRQKDVNHVEVDSGLDLDSWLFHSLQTKLIHLHSVPSSHKINVWFTFQCVPYLIDPSPIEPDLFTVLTPWLQIQHCSPPNLENSLAPGWCLDLRTKWFGLSCEGLVVAFAGRLWSWSPRL